MLTIFTTCKPCDVANNDLEQRQAMTSWTFLDPKPEVLVMGTDEGTEAICKDLGFTWIPEVEKSDPGGVPYLDSMFKIAEERAQNDHLALVSSDLFLFYNTPKALDVCRRKFKEFCAVCRKRQQRSLVELNFANRKEWHRQIYKNLRWNLITSGDFYMFNKGFWGEIPKFVIGRCACDSWLFWEASQRGQMIDLSPAIDVIDYQHQHDHWKVKGDTVGDDEKIQNVVLAGTNKASIADANWIMDRNFEIKEAE